MNIPKNTVDLMFNSGKFPANTFFATGRLVSHGGNVLKLNESDVNAEDVVIDIKDAPVIANGDSVRHEFGLSKDQMMTREEFNIDYKGIFNDYYALSAGSYLWVNDEMPLVIRDHPTICPGFLINPSGMVDGKPSEVAMIETLEESPIVFEQIDGTFTVPVLINPECKGLNASDLIHRKAEQHDKILEQLRERYNRVGVKLAYKRLDVLPVEEDAPFMRNVKIVHGNTLVDEVKSTHVWYQGQKTEKLRIISMHNSFKILKSNDVSNMFAVDGEPFGREGLFKTEAELMVAIKKEDQEYGERIFSFMENYLHLRSLVQNHNKIIGPMGPKFA